MPDVDWNRLRHSAVEVMAGAYAPYSGFAVGAAALTREGRLVTGCNVENVSYGLGVCAEVSLVSDMYRGGADRLVAISVAGPRGQVLMPCGRCRQVLAEHSDADLLVDHPDSPRRLGDLLPDAFGPADLAVERDPADPDDGVGRP